MTVRQKSIAGWIAGGAIGAVIVPRRRMLGAALGAVIVGALYDKHLENERDECLARAFASTDEQTYRFGDITRAAMKCIDS